MARAVFGARARADVADIHAYIAERNPAAARRVVAAIRHTTELLGCVPIKRQGGIPFVNWL